MKDFADKYNEVIVLDTDIYPPESIQLAACAFLDDAFFYLFPAGGRDGKLDGINVAIKPRDERKEGIEKLAGKFANELNRQSLRLALDKMNRNIRMQIVGRALTSAIPRNDKGTTETG